MRCYQNGFEELTITSTTRGLALNGIRNTAVPRKDPTLNGGLGCFQPTGSYGYTTSYATLITSMAGGVARTSVYIRGCAYLTVASSDARITIDKSGTGALADARFNTVSRAWDLYVAGTLRVSGTTVINTTQWHRVEIFFQVAAAGTTNATLRVDDVIQGSTTVATNTVAATFDRFYYGSSANPCYWDDLAVNDTWTVVPYDGGNGTLPVAGDTLTSGGKTATVKGQVGDGVLGIILITGGAGGAFADNDAITGTAGFVGVANGAEKTDNCTWPGEGFVIWLVPSASGTTSQLTNSAGTSVNNYSYVDDNETTTDYVEGAADGLFDTYAITNLPADALRVNAVFAVGYSVKQSSAISNIAAETRQAAANVEWYKQALPTGYAWLYWWLIQDPATLVPWLVADVNSVEAGVKVKT